MNANENLNALMLVKAAKHHLPSLGETLKRRSGTPELPLTTMPELSRKMWGIAPRELTVVGARTSQGKSTLCLQIAYDLASQKIPVLYLSLEMTVSSILERMFCYHSMIPNINLLTGKFGEYQNQWAMFTQHISQSPLIVTEGIGKNWGQINNIIDALDPKPRVIILDYIQCISGAGLEKKEQIDEYIRSFRQMAIEYNFAAIVCSQVNRSGVEVDGNKEPQIHHLKSSGYLEELADKIILLHYPYFYDDKSDPNNYTLILAKNRNGRTGRVNMRFIPEYFRFEDAVIPVTKYSNKVKEILQIVNGTEVTEFTNSPKT